MFFEIDITSFIIIYSNNILRNIIDVQKRSMESMGIVQVRISESVKENAAYILDKFGLNMPTYINTTLNQLIIQEGIPFSVKLAKSSYADEEKIREAAATLRLEGLDLSDSDLNMLREIKSGNISIDEARAKILSGK